MDNGPAPRPPRRPQSSAGVGPHSAQVRRVRQQNSARGMRNLGLSNSGPVAGGFNKGHDRGPESRSHRNLRPRTASGVGNMWGNGGAGGGIMTGGSFMTQGLMEDDSTETLPLFVELGSPRPEDRIHTQRQVRMFEIMSRQYVPVTWAWANAATAPLEVWRCIVVGCVDVAVL